MKLLKTLALASPLVLLACDHPETALVPLYVPLPNLNMDMNTGLLTCEFDPSAPATIDLTLDLDTARELYLVVATRNTLNPVSVEVTSEEEIPVPRSVTPINFDYRWECDATGFSGDVGPIFLPAFAQNDINRPFCLAKRGEAVNEPFSGFAVVSATGQAIDPGSVGMVEFTPVSKPLGDSLADFFDISRLAEQCCQAYEAATNQSCENIADVASSPAQCQSLQRVLDQFAPGAYSITDVATLSRFRPFSIYAQTNDGYPAVPYDMRLSGIIEGVLPSGELVTSSRFNQNIGFCTTCDMSVAVQACLTH